MQNQIDVTGAVTYWTLTERTNLDILKSELEVDGLEKFVPQPRTPLDTLKQAAEEIYPGCMLRPLAHRKGLDVVKETPGQVQNDYQHVDSVTCEPVACQNGHLNDLQSAYYRWEKLVPSSHVTRRLVEAINEFGGHRLRDTGGVYWIPKWALAKWGFIRDALAKAGGSVVYTLTTRCDPESVGAIIDGLRESVGSELKEIGEDFTEENIGERAVGNRKERLMELRAQLKKVEGLLNVNLADLATDIDNCENLAGLAALAAAAEVGVE
jgi:hypothetical protein